MKTIADFRRAATPGSKWQCVNHRLPHMSGLRTITRGSTVLSYDAEKADGTVVRNGRMEIPKAGAVRIEGDSVHFLFEPGSDRVAFTWTLVTETAPASEPVICGRCDVEYPSRAALDEHQRTEAARDAEAASPIESNAAGGTATERQISEQRTHLANVLEAYQRLTTGDLPWRSFAASPDLAEGLAWKKVVEARETLRAWTANGGVTPQTDETLANARRVAEGE